MAFLNTCRTVPPRCRTYEFDSTEEVAMEQVCGIA
jgi:hypothetical protein